MHLPTMYPARMPTINQIKIASTDKTVNLPSPGDVSACAEEQKKAPPFLAGLT